LRSKDRSFCSPKAFCYARLAFVLSPEAIKQSKAVKQSKHATDCFVFATQAFGLLASHFLLRKKMPKAKQA
jgi:hypothetical protein